MVVFFGLFLVKELIIEWIFLLIVFKFCFCVVVNIWIIGWMLYFDIILLIFEWDKFVIVFNVIGMLLVLLDGWFSCKFFRVDKEFSVFWGVCIIMG